MQLSEHKKKKGRGRKRTGGEAKDSMSESVWKSVWPTEAVNACDSTVMSESCEYMPLTAKQMAVDKIKNKIMNVLRFLRLKQVANVPTGTSQDTF